MPINIEQGKSAMVAAEAEARQNNWQVVITILDAGGHLVMLQRLETQNASVDISIGKARCRSSSTASSSVASECRAFSQRRTRWSPGQAPIRWRRSRPGGRGRAPLFKGDAHRFGAA